MVGPPGSGKTTYCHGVQQFLNAMSRKVVMVNLDPANENIPYACDVDVCDLLSLEDAMKEFSLGPNGGLLYCMETLVANFEWLQAKLQAFDLDSYFVFDLPGQAELFINHESIYQLIRLLDREMKFRLVTVHLADSTHCKESSRFISLAVLTLQSMLRLECPQISLMSKFDLFDKGPSSTSGFPLSYYADCLDLKLMADSMEQQHPSAKRFRALNEAIVDLVDDFGLVSFIPFAVEDRECMAFVLQEADKANGLVFGGLTADNESIQQAAMSLFNRDQYLESMEKKYIKNVE